MLNPIHLDPQRTRCPQKKSWRRQRLLPWLFIFGFFFALTVILGSVVKSRHVPTASEMEYSAGAYLDRLGLPRAGAVQCRLTHDIFGPAWICHAALPQEGRIVTVHCDHKQMCWMAIP